MQPKHWNDKYHLVSARKMLDMSPSHSGIFNIIIRQVFVIVLT